MTVYVPHFCCLLWRTWSTETFDKLCWTRLTQIQLNSVWLYRQIWSNALQSPWILLFFFSFFWVLFLIYFLTFYLILHVSTVTEELYKTNWHITLPCRCCQMCSMIHCRDLGIQGSVLLQIMSRTISKASLVVWILHFCLVLKWYSLHRYSTRQGTVSSLLYVAGLKAGTVRCYTRKCELFPHTGTVLTSEFDLKYCWYKISLLHCSWWN